MWKIGTEKKIVFLMYKNKNQENLQQNNYSQLPVTPFRKSQLLFCTDDSQFQKTLKTRHYFFSQIYFTIRITLPLSELIDTHSVNCVLIQCLYNHCVSVSLNVHLMCQSLMLCDYCLFLSNYFHLMVFWNWNRNIRLEFQHFWSTKFKNSDSSHQLLSSRHGDLETKEKKLTYCPIVSRLSLCFLSPGGSDQTIFQMSI